MFCSKQHFISSVNFQQKLHIIIFICRLVNDYEDYLFTPLLCIMYFFLLEKYFDGMRLYLQCSVKLKGLVQKQRKWLFLWNAKFSQGLWRGNEDNVVRDENLIKILLCHFCQDVQFLNNVTLHEMLNSPKSYKEIRGII